MSDSQEWSPSGGSPYVTSPPPARGVTINRAAHTWRKIAMVSIVVGPVLGVLVGAAWGDPERPPHDVTLTNPSPNTTGSPLPPIRGAQRLPDGTALLTLADGRIITATSGGGRVVYNGTEQRRPDRTPLGGVGDDGATDVARLYFSNCAAMARAGMAPLFEDEPGYRTGLDPDRDGVACE